MIWWIGQLPLRVPMWQVWDIWSRWCLKRHVLSWLHQQGIQVWYHSCVLSWLFDVIESFHLRILWHRLIIMILDSTHLFLRHSWWLLLTLYCFADSSSWVLGLDLLVESLTTIIVHVGLTYATDIHGVVGRIHSYPTQVRNACWWLRSADLALDIAYLTALLTINLIA